MAKKKRRVKENKVLEQGDEKTFAFLATFLTIIGFVIAIIAKKHKSEYVKFYAKQGIIIFIASIVVGIIGGIVGWIPILGGIIKAGLSIILLVLWVLSWIYALSGEKKEVPLIGKYAGKFEL